MLRLVAQKNPLLLSLFPKNDAKSDDKHAEFSLICIMLKICLWCENCFVVRPWDVQDFHQLQWCSKKSKFFCSAIWAIKHNAPRKVTNFELQGPRWVNAIKTASMSLLANKTMINRMFSKTTARGGSLYHRPPDQSSFVMVSFAASSNFVIGNEITVLTTI